MHVQWKWGETLSVVASIQYRRESFNWKQTQQFARWTASVPAVTSLYNFRIAVAAVVDGVDVGVGVGVGADVDVDVAATPPDQAPCVRRAHKWTRSLRFCTKLPTDRSTWSARSGTNYATPWAANRHSRLPVRSQDPFYRWCVCNGNRNRDLDGPGTSGPYNDGVEPPSERIWTSPIVVRIVGPSANAADAPENLLLTQFPVSWLQYGETQDEWSTIWLFWSISSSSTSSSRK